MGLTTKMASNSSLANQKLNYIKSFINPNVKLNFVGNVGDSLKIAKFSGRKVSDEDFSRPFGFLGPTIMDAWNSYISVEHEEVPANFKADIQQTIQEFGLRLLQKNAGVEFTDDGTPKISRDGVSKLLMMIFSICQVEDGGLRIYNWQMKRYEGARTQIIERALAAVVNTVKFDGWNPGLEHHVMELNSRSLRPIKVGSFDSEYFSFGSNILDMNTLRDAGPADPNKLTFMYSDVQYDPMAKCPQFEKFINETLDDKKSQDFLQEYTGYMLDNTFKANAFLILYGIGNNGKSVYSNTAKLLLNPLFVSSSSIETFSGQFGVAPLVGKRADISTEGQEVNFDTAMLKSITSGDPIMVNAKNEQQYTTVIKARLLFSTNLLPRANDTTKGFSRRLYILPFKNQVAREKVDLDLEKKLAAELPGILNWALDGLSRLRANGYVFSVSTEMQSAKDRYLMEGHPVQMFVKSHLESCSGAKILLSELRTAYQQWLMAEDIADLGTLNPKVFSRKLKDAFQAVYGFEAPIVIMHEKRKGLAGYRVN